MPKIWTLLVIFFSYEGHDDMTYSLNSYRVPNDDASDMKGCLVTKANPLQVPFIMANVMEHRFGKKYSCWSNFWIHCMN